MEFLKNHYREEYAWDCDMPSSCRWDNNYEYGTAIECGCHQGEELLKNVKANNGMIGIVYVDADGFNKKKVFPIRGDSIESDKEYALAVFDDVAWICKTQN